MRRGTSRVSNCRINFQQPPSAAAGTCSHALFGWRYRSHACSREIHFARQSRVAVMQAAAYFVDGTVWKIVSPPFINSSRALASTRGSSCCCAACILNSASIFCTAMKASSCSSSGPAIIVHPGRLGFVSALCVCVRARKTRGLLPSVSTRCPCATSVGFPAPLEHKFLFNRVDGCSSAVFSDEHFPPRPEGKASGTACLLLADRVDEG